MEEIAAIVLGLVMLTAVHVGIGIMVRSLVSDKEDPSITWACIVFWPIAILILAVRGLFRILKGEV